MRLFNYFEQLIDDFIDINGLYLYPKLVSNKQEAEEIAKKNNLRLLNINEFSRFTYQKKNNILKLLKEKMKIILDDSYIFLIKSDLNYIYKNNKFEETSSNAKNKIAIFKKVIIREEREYKTLESLDQPNIAIMTTKEDDSIKIVCYDIELLKNEFNQEKIFKTPILFFGSIKKHDPSGNDKKSSISKEDQAPYGAYTVEFAAAREDVAGSSTLYPIMAYYADNPESEHNHLLIPDRGSVSDDAQKVWEKFLKRPDNSLLKKFIPIDDIYYPITQDPFDDGEVYARHGKLKEKSSKEAKEFLQNKNLTDVERKKELEDFRKNDELNWVYKLNKNQINSVKTIVKQLKENHYKNLSFFKDNNFSLHKMFLKGYDLHMSKRSNK
jgi:hypothetical protein